MEELITEADPNLKLFCFSIVFIAWLWYMTKLGKDD